MHSYKSTRNKICFLIYIKQVANAITLYRTHLLTRNNLFVYLPLFHCLNNLLEHNKCINYHQLQYLNNRKEKQRLLTAAF